MIQYEQHPLNANEIAQIKGVLLGREMQLLRRSLEAMSNAHFLDALNFRAEVRIDPSATKRAAEADDLEKKAITLAWLVHELDSLTNGDYRLFTIKVNS